MSEYGVYGQWNGFSFAVGIDTSNGVTATLGVQLAPFGFSAASSTAVSTQNFFNFSYEGVSVYAGGGTPTFSPPHILAVTAMMNLNTEDYFVSYGVAPAGTDILEFGVYAEGGAVVNAFGKSLLDRLLAVDPIQTYDFWQQQIEEVQNDPRIPDAVKRELLQDLLQAREIPAYRDEVADRYGLVPVDNSTNDQDAMYKRDASASAMVPGQTQTILTPSGLQTTNVMQTVDTPSGEQQVWVGSSYLGGGTSGDNSAQTGTTTTGQTTSGHQSGPGNGYLVGNANSNSSNHDDDNDNSNTNIWNNGHDNDPDMNEAAGGGAGGASGSVTTTTTTSYEPTFPTGGPGTFPVGSNGTSHTSTSTTTTTTTTTQIIGPQPILLDLDGNGIQLTDLNRSTVFMEGEEGLKHRTAWAGAGDGVLFYDTDGDDKISDIREYVFTEWDPTAKDDLSALRARFDSNGDGKLTGTELGGFKVMKTNADGSLTAVTLASLGITQINLTQDATQIALPDGSQITGLGAFVMSHSNRNQI